MKRKIVAVIVFAGVMSVWFAALPLLAQDVSQPLSREDKRMHLRQGIDLLEKKEYEKAYQFFLSLDGRYAELQDYVSYFLALSLKHLGRLPEATDEFQHVLSRVPSHPLQNEVRFLVADSLFDMKQYAEALVWYQQLPESLPGREAELIYKRGITLKQTGHTQEAVAKLHLVITFYPGSDSVKKAQAALKEILEKQPDLTPVWTEQSTLDYANTLFEARLYSAAIKQYSSFQRQYPESKHIGDSEFGVADAYFRLGQATRGMKLLEEMAARYTESQPHVAAKALYTIGTKHWYADRNRQAKRVMQRIVTEFRETEWSDRAYYVLGRIYQSQHDYQAAAQWYASLFTLYPESSFAEEALWRAGWSWYLERHFPKAIEQFSQAGTTFPTGGYADDSLYWMGRSQEKQQKLSAAATAYHQLVAVSPKSYYAIQAQRRLAALQTPWKAKHRSSVKHPDWSELLTEFSRQVPAQLFQEVVTHMRTSRELYEVGHTACDAFARKEVIWIGTLLERHFTEYPDAEPQAMSVYLLGRLYNNIGLYLPAIQLAPKIEKILIAANIQTFPYDRERVSYPLEYWELIQKYAAIHQLDPFLVAGIIRQESAYNPKARSSADARGLMQVLPQTGRRVAKQIGLKNFKTADLYDPETSIALGSAYLAGVLGQFEGDVFRAIAAYNAGPRATNKWWPAEGAADSEEVTENITYRETRNYVKRVLRNQQNYRRIYSDMVEN